jgi:hypothetical protein
MSAAAFQTPLARRLARPSPWLIAAAVVIPTFMEVFDFDNAVWPTLIFRFGPPHMFFDRSQFRTLKVIHFKDR